jgi:peroxiredoxin
MKKTLLLLALGSILFSCDKLGDDGFIVEGTAKGIENGKKVFLEKQNEAMGTVPVDTAVVQDGKFKFEGKIAEPELHLISFEGVQPKSFVIVENGEINIEIQKDSVFNNKITGTYNNEQLTEFNALGVKISRKLKAFQTANNVKMKTAVDTKDTATVNQLRATYQSIQKEMQTETENYIKNHPKSFVGLLLLESFFAAPQPDIAKIEALYKGLDAELKNTKIGKKIEKSLSEVKAVGIGSKAPEFSGPNPEGKQVSLASSLGKVTIIDFWASWCGPCRAENPNVVALYNEFHSKGLNIIGVSLDRPGQADKWKEAIAKDGLTWTHVSNLKFWEDPIATTYGVKSIPATFILNEAGLVIAKDLRGPELRAKVAQLLGA